ncbi:MAG: glycosyltransferase [Thermoplasmata archaeon]|jgi:glycosyltransferase involved in cell wall biosynthesis
MAGHPRSPGEVTVIVTVLNDPRVRRTIESLRTQHRGAASIVVDDGGGAAGEVRRIAEELARSDTHIHWLDAPGSIAASRNTALARVDSEFVAFLDADEIAPADWLARLLAPFSDPAVGFTGGPTPGLPGSARGRGVRYYDGYLRRFYDVVARNHPHALPMGNSAWRMAVFDRNGLLDTTLLVGAGNEDHDMAVRALEAGWKGVYVPEAAVDHDFSDLTSWSILRKQSHYAFGGFALWRRRRSTYEASGSKLAPYVVLPALLVLGAILLVPGPTRTLGAVLLAFGAVGMAVLALALTVQGVGWDRTYPGMRYRAFEILRRWATLWGATRGFLRFGWSGRRSATRATAVEPPESGKR